MTFFIIKFEIILYNLNVFRLNFDLHSFAVLSGIFANIFGQWIGLCK